MREVLPDADILPQHFRKNGYRASGSGKMLHCFIDARSWDEYFPKKESGDPFPRTLYPEKRPVNLPVGGPWQYGETDWAALDATDEEFGGDWLVSRREAALAKIYCLASLHPSPLDGVCA